jgi:hypothetical protein
MDAATSYLVSRLFFSTPVKVEQIPSYLKKKKLKG